MAKKVELLAPCGNYESLHSVLGAGADAVYAGGKLFGARAYAGNFDKDELITAIREVHVLGKKLYLTVNTLLKNKELYGELYDYLAPLYEEGLDAVLVQDFGVLSFIRRFFPELPVHASTQMAVTGAGGMRFLETLGVERIVAARELSLEEIRGMHEESPLEIEVFIHGAMCYSYSGRCLMSSLIGGRSGNRGRCAQPCRLPYEVLPIKTGKGSSRPGISEKKGASPATPLSMKDMNTIGILPDIVEAGVSSLKIEGRMKSKEYASGVTAIYRKYLDQILKSGFRREDYHVSNEDQRQLTELFSRGGSCAGYYQNYHGRFMIDLKGEKKTGEAEAISRDPKTGIRGKLVIRSGEPVRLEVQKEALSAVSSTQEPEKAAGKPLTREDVRSKMDRLGNTLYTWDSLEIELEEGLFVPVKLLNNLRRSALMELTRIITGSFRRSLPEGSREEACEAGRRESSSRCGAREASGKRKPETSEGGSPFSPPDLYVSCEDRETALFLLEACTSAHERVRITGLYVPLRILDGILEERDRISALSGKESLPRIYGSLPMITRRCPEDAAAVLKDYLGKGAAGFLVKDPEMLSVMVNAGLAGFAVADASLYTWNDEASAFLRKLGILRNTVPLELNEGEIRRRDNHDSEMLVYGYLPMMVSAQCAGSCTGCRQRLFLKDRLGKKFPVQCECTPWKGQDTEKHTLCYNIIYNSLPYGLPEESSRVRACGIHSVRLSFTLEEPEEALRICRLYESRYLRQDEEGGMEDAALSAACRDITKGHFKRGAL